MAPRLSILIPVYNESATVERALEAVLAADLPVESELIVVDDGSTDGTSEILARGDWPADRVRLLRHD
jgi:glycosyltransferase involved in cell wall biosynthesis